MSLRSAFFSDMLSKEVVEVAASNTRPSDFPFLLMVLDLL